MPILISNTSLSTFFSAFNVSRNDTINKHKLLGPITLYTMFSDPGSKEEKQNFNSIHKEFSEPQQTYFCSH